MSDSAGRSYDSIRETADRDNDRAVARPAGTEAAGQRRAEPMSRQDYADYMRQEPAAEAEQWPTSEERARLHEVYLGWREAVAAGRESSTNVAGEKPDRSPADRNDLPPTGEELLEGESGERSRLDALRREWETEDVLDGLHSETEQDVNTIQSILEAHPPEGHPVQVMPDQPNVAPVVPAGIDAGGVAAAGLMIGVVLVEAGRRVHESLRQGRGADHAR